MADYEKKGLERKIEQLEKELERVKSSNEYYEKKADDNENYLRLFGRYDGLRIPFDAEMKKEISSHIKKMMYDAIKEDNELEDKFIKSALIYKDAFIRIFKPIVKEMIEDLDFNVRFQSYEGD